MLSRHLDIWQTPDTLQSGETWYSLGLNILRPISTKLASDTLWLISVVIFHVYVTISLYVNILTVIFNDYNI